MNKTNRREFLKVTAGAFGANLFPARAIRGSALAFAQLAPVVTGNAGKKPLRLGLIIGVGQNPDTALAKVRDLGIPTAQIYAEDFSTELVPKLKAALEKYKIEGCTREI